MKLAVSEKWSGLRPLSGDGLPIMGKLAGTENLFIATAHFRNGILLAPMTARILADKIVRGLDSDFLEIYSPNRVESGIAK